MYSKYAVKRMNTLIENKEKVLCSTLICMSRAMWHWRYCSRSIATEERNQFDTNNRYPGDTTELFDLRIDLKYYNVKHFHFPQFSYFSNYCFSFLLYFFCRFWHLLIIFRSQLFKYLFYFSLSTITVHLLFLKTKHL